jgi:hypothetical protein
VPTPVPSLPLTIPDLVCEDDLDPFARETTSDLQSLEQDCLHVILEEPDSNLDDPGRGIGIAGLLSGTSVDLALAQSHIDSELQKDDRIDAVRSEVTDQGDGEFDLIIEIAVGAATLGLSYSYTASGGLQAVG